jgi:hypothetical protein
LRICFPMRRLGGYEDKVMAGGTPANPAKLEARGDPGQPCQARGEC